MLYVAAAGRKQRFAEIRRATTAAGDFATESLAGLLDNNCW